MTSKNRGISVGIVKTSTVKIQNLIPLPHNSSSYGNMGPKVDQYSNNVGANPRGNTVHSGRKRSTRILIDCSNNNNIEKSDP